MTVSAAKIVDLVAAIPREQAIEMVESWARVRAQEASIVASRATLEHILEHLRRPQPKAVLNETGAHG